MAPRLLYSSKRLVIFDADGTTIDAYSAIEATFSRHGMAIGDEERFQKRRRIFKYLGGIREFPGNLKKQVRKESRKELISTMTEVYRQETKIYPGIAALIQTLIDAPDIIVGLVTRNVSNEPEETLRRLFLGDSRTIQDQSGAGLCVRRRAQGLSGGQCFRHASVHGLVRVRGSQTTDQEIQRTGGNYFAHTARALRSCLTCPAAEARKTRAFRLMSPPAFGRYQARRWPLRSRMSVSTSAWGA